jgi:hypothetical protein
LFARITYVSSTVHISLIVVQETVEAGVGDSVVGAYTVGEAVVGAGVQRNNSRRSTDNKSFSYRTGIF